jgi:hypothetical protein
LRLGRNLFTGWLGFSRLEKGLVAAGEHEHSEKSLPEWF